MLFLTASKVCIQIGPGSGAWKVNIINKKSSYEIDRVHYIAIRERGMKEDIVNRVEKEMLRWFGQVEKMNEITI